MREILLLLSISKIQSVRTLRQLFATSKQRMVIAAILWILFWGFLFILFNAGWKFLERSDLALIRDQISFVIWNLFFFPLMTMIAFSACIISFTSFFQNKETDFLLTLPVSDVAIFFHKMRESIGFAGWATMFIGLPLVITFGLHHSETLLFYPLAFIAFIPFVIFSASVGVIVALLIGLIIPKSKKLIVWALIIVSGLGLWKLIEWFLEGRASISAGEENLWVAKIFNRVSILSSEFIPSSWMTRTIEACTTGNWESYIYNVSVIAANALLIFHVALLIGWFTLRKAREMVSVSTSARKRKSNGLFTISLRKILFFLDTASQEIIIKDVKNFTRTPGQWAQFLIFFGLLAFYILNLRTFNYHVQGTYWKTMIAVTNLTAIGLVLASFTGRFVFPLMSLEGNRIWILGLSPISRTKIVMAKFWFSFIGSTGVSVFLVIASDLLLDLSLTTLIVHICTMAIVCLGLSGLAVGLGAIYPNYREENPSRIISGFGGTVNLVFSLAYVMVTIIVVSVPYRHLQDLSGSGKTVLISVTILAALILAFCATVIPMSIGIKLFKKSEF